MTYPITLTVILQHVSCNQIKSSQHTVYLKFTWCYTSIKPEKNDLSPLNSDSFFNNSHPPTLLFLTSTKLFFICIKASRSQCYLFSQITTSHHLYSHCTYLFSEILAPIPEPPTPLNLVHYQPY